MDPFWGQMFSGMASKRDYWLVPASPEIYLDEIAQVVSVCTGELSANRFFLPPGLVKSWYGYWCRRAKMIVPREENVAVGKAIPFAIFG